MRHWLKKGIRKSCPYLLLKVNVNLKIAQWPSTSWFLLLQSLTVLHSNCRGRDNYFSSQWWQEKSAYKRNDASCKNGHLVQSYTIISSTSQAFTDAPRCLKQRWDWMHQESFTTEGKRLLRLDESCLSSFMILKESIIQDERDTIHWRWQLKGTSSLLIPFYVTLFNEASVRLYHSICSCAYRCHWNNCVQHQLPKQLFYYALVLPQPSKGQAPIAVAEFISSSHSMLTISHFLNTFHYGETKLFGGTTCQPKYVIMSSWTEFSNIWVCSLFLQ